MMSRLHTAARHLALAIAVPAGLIGSSAAAQNAGSAAPAEDHQSEVIADLNDRVAVHGQTTFVYQGHDSFRSPFRGANSLYPGADGRETWDVTLYAGLRPWKGAEVWIDPEIDQGFGLSNTLGAAGFPSGEAYKVGKAEPYPRLQRLFIRQTIDLGGDPEKIESDLNQFSGTRTANRIVITFGKFSVGDVFDTNKYAHDPRGDFLNWTIIDAGSFDYAADAWGYSAGGAAEWYQGDWTIRGGAFLLSNVPNSIKIDTRFDQFQLIGEVEERHTLLGLSGKLKLTGFISRGRMGRLDDATALAERTALPADASAVRRYASRPGFSLSLEQQLTGDLGLFARAGWADGSFEAYEFTDVDRSFSGGLSLIGKRWGRGGDTVGLAGVINQASAARERYFGAGGLGILVGDGRLHHEDSERIAELFYDAALIRGMHVALNYQRIGNPGYDADRGPVDVLAMRLHVQF